MNARKKHAAALEPQRVFPLLLLDEGQAVRTLIDRRVAFMRTDADLIQCAVILAAAVVVALGDMALDRVVGLFVCKAHTKHPPF